MRCFFTCLLYGKSDSRQGFTGEYDGMDRFRLMSSLRTHLSVETSHDILAARPLRQQALPWYSSTVRYIIVLVGLLSLSSVVWAQQVEVKTIGDYYRGQAEAKRLPIAATYRRTYHQLAATTWESPSDAEFAKCVYEEVNLMLSALGQSELSNGLEPDLLYPFAVRTRGDGKVREGLIWLAACHGLVRAMNDQDAYFLSPDEYAGIPSCFGDYSGPPRRPRY